MPITKLMEGLPSRTMPQAEFDAASEKYMAELPDWGDEANSLEENVNAKEASATAAAATAITKANEASDSADDAQLFKEQASSFADAAAESANAAHASELAAANSSTSLTANSTTAVVLGNGTKVFTVPAGKQFPPGELLQVGSTGTPAARMFGTVASYVGTTLTVTTTLTEGPAGTYSDWVITPGGARGPGGGTAGGQLTGALDELKGTAPASSATPDVWNAGGNYVPITQTATITGLPNASQPGAKRTLKAESTFSITSSTNFFVHGGSTVINPGDELDIVADTVSKFLVTVRRNNGAGAGATGRNTQVLKASTVWAAQITGWHTVMLVGAAGSGACAIGVGGARAAASGSSTAGIVLKTFYATAGDTYTLVLGARGASVTTPSTGANVALNGNDAVDSTFVGGSVSLTAGGGKKGNATVGSTSSTVAAGAVGGTASGGDYNFPGSPSGSVTITMSGAGIQCNGASGGAAPPYKGSANKSGDVQVTSGGGGSIMAASGGAGVGGKSGNVTLTNDMSASAGANAYSPSANVTNSVLGTAPVIDTDFLNILLSIPLNLTGASTNAVQNATSGTASSGAGTGGTIGSGIPTTIGSGSASMLGGTGGVTCQTGSSGMTMSSGDSTYGGGTGGVSLSSGSLVSATLTSGNGGQAFAVIISP
ncbi:hypothetical protein GJ698_02090 [Pseudoduganella sp. FT26W]|uniref:Uncharacterized protein n=1 Tax=Duganella aquatilis TaxID=2666082 RepID=A0A844D5V1_9BURK|nr:hypothetical protein [Duganella aquatilis]MRW82880.1 hypothetical protein [Duganella aquatilis]